MTRRSLICAAVLTATASTLGAQMPDPRMMSGQIMPAPELAPGTVTVRIIRQSIMNVVPGVEVELHGAGEVRRATSGPDGRAAFTGIGVIITSRRDPSGAAWSMKSCS